MKLHASTAAQGLAGEGAIAFARLVRARCTVTWYLVRGIASSQRLIQSDCLQVVINFTNKSGCGMQRNTDTE